MENLQKNSVLSLDPKMVLKLDIGENGGARRIPLPKLFHSSSSRVSYDRLAALAIEYSYPHEGPNRHEDYIVTVTYVDEDGDIITVSSDTELGDAFAQFVNSAPPVLRAKAFVRRSSSRVENATANTMAGNETDVTDPEFPSWNNIDISTSSKSSSSVAGGVVKKWSEQTYPGFNETKSYIESMGIMDYGGNSVGVGNTSCYFLDDSSGRAQKKMEDAMNFPKFRWYYNLLPAGTDPITAFCQIMALRYRKDFQLEGLSGTYLIKFNLWTKVYEHKNEAQLSQQVNFTYSASNKADFNALICL